ncbi:hypothetical protein FIBSPDRAFT_1037806 [Athelia psychrophila]|uniref:F-box domain-containing protein n=1 Tax=Athelia psychrophila TaxID=1759441 RepID=A0A166U6F0_9AGAM|nr:hypothetical protein FIBSPDRAFT_1037806 [Fibularhizoctonia sp. CBS 109695]
MNDIPIDVLFSILDLTHPADLPALCRVNKELQCHASAILYRNLTPAQGNIIDICGTLCRSPHLALRVKHFTVTLYAASLLVRDDYTLVAQTLRCLVNLQSLVFFFYGTDSWMLEHCTFKLRSFHSTLDTNTTLLSFLRTQSELTTLNLQADVHNHQLPLPFLPNLTHIDAPFSWVSQLVPGRPVEEMQIYEQQARPHLPTHNISFLSLSTSPMRRLIIGSPSLRALPTREVHRLLPDIETLVMRLPLKITSRVDEETQSLEQWLRSLLSGLPHLHSFTLTTCLHSFSWSDADELLFLENAVALAPNVATFVTNSPRFPRIRTDWRRFNDGWGIEQRDSTFPPKKSTPVKTPSPAEPTKLIRPGLAARRVTYPYPDYRGAPPSAPTGTGPPEQDLNLTIAELESGQPSAANV